MVSLNDCIHVVNPICIFWHRNRLGLYLVREILAITGIQIKETGEPGKGARFEITVPRGSYRFTKV
ncbi:hypothetical protein [Methanoregula sp.]|uniref:hypothetical protein n=1 Tax=Methanoregula sp. TaxID=2052170 RepID=UPI003C73989A